jgi:hypothetical protein
MRPSLLLTSARIWTKFTQARNSLDDVTGVFARDAAKWDLLGSIARYTGLPTRQAELRLLKTETFKQWSEDNARAEYRCLPTLADFNDTTQFEYVQQALREANL